MLFLVSSEESFSECTYCLINSVVAATSFCRHHHHFRHIQESSLYLRILLPVRWWYGMLHANVYIYMKLKCRFLLFFSFISHARIYQSHIFPFSSSYFSFLISVLHKHKSKTSIEHKFCVEFVGDSIFLSLSITETS